MCNLQGRLIPVHHLNGHIRTYLSRDVAPVKQSKSPQEPVQIKQRFYNVAGDAGLRAKYIQRHNEQLQGKEHSGRFAR